MAWPNPSSETYIGEIHRLLKRYSRSRSRQLDLALDVVSDFFTDIPISQRSELLARIVSRYATLVQIQSVIEGGEAQITIDKQTTLDGLISSGDTAH